MLSSITPLGERGRGRRWGPTVTAFVVGSTVGGAALGAACGGMGVVLNAVAPGARSVALAAVIAALAALRLTGRLPSWRRQVDERWLDVYRGWVVGAGYGLQLGVAVVTIVPSAVTWLVLAVAVATGSVWWGAVVGAMFGLVRALPVLAARRVVDADALHRFHRRLDRLRAPVARGTSVIGVVAGALLLGTSAAGVG